MSALLDDTWPRCGDRSLVMTIGGRGGDVAESSESQAGSRRFARAHRQPLVERPPADFPTMFQTDFVCASYVLGEGFARDGDFLRTEM